MLIMNKLLKMLSKETTSNVGSDILMLVSLIGATALSYIGKNKIDELLIENRELRQKIKMKDYALNILEKDLDSHIKKVKTELEKEKSK